MGLLKFARTSPVQFDPDQILSEAVDIMITNEILSAPVVKDKQLTGVLNLASALKWIRAGDNAPREGKVKDVMQTEIIAYRKNLELEGVLKWDSSWFPVEDGLGDFTGIIPLRDLIVYLNKKLTKHIKQNQAMLESIPQLASVQQLNRELDAIIESSYDGIAIIDQEGRGIRINKAHARLTGLDASHFEGKYFADLSKNGFFQYESITAKAVRERRTVTSVQKINTGKEVLVTSNPIFDAEGNLSRVVNNVRDVTELHQLKEELKKSKLQATRYQTELSQYMLEQLKKDKIIAESPSMMKLFNLAVRAAQTDATVLILGESGVGKEVLSRVIHNKSNRMAAGGFIQINCGAIPENLLESELFGYEPGAFTGANPKGKAGMFEIANRGTLLLDEIADLPLNLQVKLLRVLQEQEVYRIGGTSPIKLDVRIIAATNRNIWKCVQEGSFREDLFYRLNVFPIEVPPLRKRKEDILPLAMHFIQLYKEKYRVQKRLDSEALPILEAYNWPGNVRELQNVLERLMVITDEELIQAAQIQVQLAKFSTEFASPIIVNELFPIKEATEMVEKELIRMAYEYYPSIRKAAKVLGLEHSNILRKAAKYGIKKK